jgi:PAS domain S-box-containing protein
LWEDSERIFCRGWCTGADGNRRAVLAVLPAAEHPPPSSLDRLAHEYGLKDEVDGAWAVRPLELVRERGRTMLLLEDPGGERLDQSLGAPMEVGSFLRLAIGITAALGKIHQRGLVHKDLKPANILVNCTDGQVRFTGFGIASRLARERQAPQPPEFIAGTLAYMAPEQTGRMNRSIDSRSDLYSLGVTLYETLTGRLPFIASDPMEWVHCHVARQPVAPCDRSKNVPATVSAIVMKLLAKTAEERYQTAAGVESDLRRCLVEWEALRGIDEFPLGQYDTPDRLLIPEKLYGRAREVDTLLASFDRIVKSGTPEFVLVSGFSGIGKSAVVNELHKVLIWPRGLFAAGKFDQYKRDIPYSTLAQAFQSLIRPLLGKSEADLSGWRDAFREALDPNGKLIVDLVPELKLIIGEQPAVPDLSAQDAQRRFQLVFRRFVMVFARPEHPLALFLDDLQWLDAATLDVLEDLLTRSDVRHLMLIGAYRSNEVNSDHPLMRKLNAIRQVGAMVQEITLAPLAREDLGRLIGECVHCEQDRTASLAHLVHEKTAGNPFFAIQFIHTLAEEGLLIFNHGDVRWSWDLARIHAKGYTDNVVDLMVGKLNRLPIETRNALQQLACLGNAAQITTLSIVNEKSAEEVHSHLWEAVRLELIQHLEGSYKFVHDRIQESTYSLIPQELRPEVHLRIGRLLVAHAAPAEREEAIFEIVNQFNRGAALITARQEREEVAELNLIAGKRAQTSTAYASALNYLIAGAAMLADDRWERQHALAFSLEISRAECEFLTSELAVAEQRLTDLSVRAEDTVEQANVACLRVDLYTLLDQSGRAVAVGLDYLRNLGVEWSPHPTEEETRREYERIWSQIGNRTIEELVDLPLMSDPASLATLDVLTKLALPALFTDVNLFSLIVCRAVNLSLQHGNSNGSCVAYVRLGMAAGARFGDYNDAFRFGRLGHELVERRGLKRFQATTYMIFGNIVRPWTRHVQTGRDLVLRAFEAANKIGDLTIATISFNQLNTNLLAAGDALGEVQREIENGMKFAEKVRFGFVIDIITAQLGFVRTLRGLTSKFGSFNDEQINEFRIEQRFSGNPNLALAECWYWIRKLQARFFAGDYASAVDASLRAQRLLWTSISQFETAEYHFYSALSHGASCDCAAASQRRQHLEAIAAHHRQLEIWAENCLENFENRAALVGAEIARLEGRELDAERLYEQAISSARANGFIHNEALANELASRFYAARGFENIARAYLREARYGYLRWGADGKVQQLDEMYPQLGKEEQAFAPAATIGAPVEHLDLATVIKVSQAVSGEIVLEKLLDTLMRTAIAQAGAERGLLVLPRGAEQRIAAEATTAGDTVIVHPRDETVNTVLLPEAVLHYVLRTRESVILDDAAAQPPFAADPYIRQRQARSILCLPLTTQAKLVGVLYLENNLTPRVFAPTRIAVLKLLASQAAIALENARLYSDLAEREAKIRRLVDANIIGIVISDLDGRIIEANDAFLHMLGYAQDDLASGIRWKELTPSEWQAASERAVAQIRATGNCDVFEKAYVRKDGSRVPVLVAGAAFEETRTQAVFFVLDLTQRKRAEEALRASEARLRMLFEHSLVGMAVNGADRHIMAVNPEFERIVGYSEDELRRIDPMQLTHEDDREAGRVFFDEIYSGRRQAYHIEKRYIHKSGRVVWVKVSASLIPATETTPTLFQAVVVDITERKCAEEALRRNEEQWRSIFEQAPVGIGIRAPDGRAVAMNPAFEKLLGYSFDEMKTRTFDEVTDPDDLPAYNQQVAATAEGKTVQVDKRYVRKDGRAVWASMTVANFAGTQSMPAGRLAIVQDITESKRAAEALRASEERWRRVFESSAVPMAVADGNRRIVAANAACGRLLGYSPEELLTLSALDFKYGDDRDFSRQMLSELEQGLRRDFQGEMRFRRKDGTPLWVNVSVAYVPASEATPALFPAVIEDVTQRKHAELERQRLASVVEQSDAFMAIADLEGTPIYLNEAGLKMVGLDDLDEARSRKVMDYVFSEDRDFVAGVARSEMMTTASWSGEFRLRHFKTGKAIPVLCNAFRINDPKTALPTNTGYVCRDITERKRAMDALRASEERWRMMFETSLVGISTNADSHYYTSANKAFQAMIGYGEAELRTLRPVELTHEDDRAKTRALVDELETGRRPSYQIEKRYRRKDGEDIWVDVYCSLVPRSESMPAFFQTVAIDITDRKRAEEGLRQVQAELARVARVTTMGELTASIAHEINQPLAAIVASGSACRRWLANEKNLDRARESVERIISDANRASEVIKRVRALTKNKAPERVRVSVNNAIEEVLVFAQAELQAREVSIRRDLDADLPMIIGDKVQLQQVLLNLIVNGIEAMAAITDRRRELVIGSRLDRDGELVISVEDTGTGLDPNHKDRIFDAFFTTKSDGMGMGLSISASIIEAHGGRLWASPGASHGTVFHFALPAVGRMDW